MVESLTSYFKFESNQSGFGKFATPACRGTSFSVLLAMYLGQQIKGRKKLRGLNGGREGRELTKGAHKGNQRSEGGRESERKTGGKEGGKDGWMEG
jgi:hypothetical protein